MADVTVYPAAAGLVDGTFSFAAGSTSNDLSHWTSLDSANLALAPGTTAREVVTITVPKSAPSGERYAVVWAQVATPSPAQSGVGLVNRVGIRMYISVGAGGPPAAEFTIGQITASRAPDGDPVVSAEVHNVGRGALDITGNVVLTGGPGGLSAGSHAIALAAPLSSRHSATAHSELSRQLPAGPWRVKLTLQSAGTRHSEVATLKFPAQVMRAFPTSLALGALIVLLGGAFIVISRQRKRFARRDRH
ncbi:MAG: peptidase [Acidobacteria bacterium]|nr:peptidase [Acidobacteriota bacterium]